MTEYGRIFFTKSDAAGVLEELEADYRKVALVVEGLSPMSVIDLGPAYGIPHYRVWGWVAHTADREKE